MSETAHPVRTFFDVSFLRRWEEAFAGQRFDKQFAMRLQKLRHADIPAALHLSRQAGWNQVEADWRRLIELAPERCLGGWVGDQLVATATLISYGGEVGWIGMVLVDKAHRRRGYGSTMFEAALQQAVDDGLAVVGLDATDAGRSVYRKYDFVDVAPIVRWGGTPHSVATTSDVRAATSEHHCAVYARDRRACGVDRRALLEHLLAEEDATGFVVAGNELRGYGVLRPGRQQFQLGPVVADEVSDLAVLLSAAAEETNGASMIVDAVTDEEADRVLRQSGLEAQRHLTRMTYPASRAVLMGNQVRCAAGFVLG